MNIVIHEDCKEALRKLIEDGVQVDSIVTDPPYELGFMGKAWDKTGIAYDVEVWQLALQVLKPGGHLLAFGGSRTYHRMACAIEDAGFEIRDQIMWIYGQGFPKSLDISKAIDKKAGAEREVVGVNLHTIGRSERVFKGVEVAGQNKSIKGDIPITSPATDLAKQWEGWGTALKPSHEDLVLAKKPYDLKALCDIMAHEIMRQLCQSKLHANVAKLYLKSNQSVYEGELDSALWNAVQKSSTPADLFVLMDTLPLELEIPMSLSIALSWLSILDEISISVNMFTTEMEISLITELKILNYLLSNSTQENIIVAVINQHGIGLNVSPVQSIFNGLNAKLKTIPELFAVESVISRAKEGGLRPDHEPIVMARKPLSEKTVAENVVKWDTGGINIDGCRVGWESKKKAEERAAYGIKYSGKKYGDESDWPKVQGTQSELGRFPANLIHDGSDEVEEEFGKYGNRPSGSIKNGALVNRTHKSVAFNKIGSFHTHGYEASTGSASRFFYCAKASKKDRQGSKHPTVKPVSLMRYLCRLITPPNGKVLDMFAGTGTTGQAAKEEGFNYILIEKEHEYIVDIHNRLNNIQKQSTQEELSLLIDN